MTFMNYLNWFPAISTSAVVGVILLLIQLMVAAFVKGLIQHEFGKKLEDVRADHHKSEESFKAELRAREQQINSLRKGALAALSNRQSALDERRIEAVDQLWSAISILSKAKMISGIMSTINYDVAAKSVSEDPRWQEAFRIMGGSFDPKKLNTTDAAKARPFVSPIAWALYSAYSTILCVAMFRYKTLELGVNAPDLVNEKSVKDLIAVVLPHRAEYLETFDLGATHHLLEEIENLLIEELQRVARGIDSDKDSIEQAAEIIKKANEVNKSMNKNNEPRPPSATD